MSSLWLGAPGIAGAGLVLMLWRRLISPTRFAQGLTAVAVSTVVFWGARSFWGGGHG